MSTVIELIEQKGNPFSSSASGNFWNDQHNEFPLVNSIHQQGIEKIGNLLKATKNDYKIRTVLLEGEPGSGKSYLLGRIKNEFKSEGFFVYVDPWINRESIWRHTLRCIIESLTFSPEGEKDSQLILWLKDLTSRQETKTNPKKFINNMKAAHPNVQWNPSLFFRMLYNLTQPDLYEITCEWLRGDELDEDNLKLLQTKKTVDTEETARGIIRNLGFVAASTKPIIICFDQLEAAGSKNSDGTVDLSPLFSLNTILHNYKANNFLIIISAVTNVWQKWHPKNRTDLDRMNSQVSLEKINLDQVKALWASRLFPFHQRATQKPSSSIYPLKEEHLKDNFPSGSTQPRSALKVAEKLIQEIIIDDPISPPPIPLAAFKIAWLEKYNKIESQVRKIRDFSSEKLVNMLQLAIECVTEEPVETHIFDGNTKFNAHSLCYYVEKSKKIGIIWNEEPNARTFTALMKRIDDINSLPEWGKIYLIRNEQSGNRNTRGYQLFQRLFNNSSSEQNKHLIPSWDSVISLATYREFYNSAKSQELTIGDEFPDVSRLQELTRLSKELEKCELLQAIGIIQTPRPKPKTTGVRETESEEVESEETGGEKTPSDEIKEFILNMVKSTLFIGRTALTNKTLHQFKSRVDNKSIDDSIAALINENEIKIINPKAKIQEQSIGLIINKKGK